MDSREKVLYYQELVAERKGKLRGTYPAYRLFWDFPRGTDCEKIEHREVEFNGKTLFEITVMDSARETIRVSLFDSITGEHTHDIDAVGNVVVLAADFMPPERTVYLYAEWRIKQYYALEPKEDARPRAIKRYRMLPAEFQGVHFTDMAQLETIRSIVSSYGRVEKLVLKSSNSDNVKDIVEIHGKTKLTLKLGHYLLRDVNTGRLFSVPPEKLDEFYTEIE